MPGVPVGRTETTRYLCAAVHLDRFFREHVLDLTIRDSYRAVSHSGGVDTALVARHAVVAEDHAERRDRYLTLVAVMLIAACVAAILLEVPPLLFQSTHAESARWFPVVGFCVVALLLAAWAICLWAEMCTVLFLQDLSLLEYGSVQDPAPPSDPDVRRRLDELERSQDNANVVVFHGFDPFAASGYLVNASSFSVELIPVGNDESMRAFTVSEMLDAVESALLRLRLRSVNSARRLFVNGSDVSRHRWLTPDPRRRPESRVSADRIATAIEKGSLTVRPYLCVETIGWSGQLAVTSFVRIVRLEGALFVELSAYVLPPLRDNFMQVDWMRERTGRELYQAALRRSRRTFLSAIAAAPGSVAERIRRVNAERRRDELRDNYLNEGLRLNYGAFTSVRKAASGERYPTYFLRRDMDMFVKVIQQRLVGAVSDFLGEHGFSTERIQSAANNYFSVNFTDGGDIYQVSNVGAGAAVGPNAKGSNVSSGNKSD